MTKVTASGIRRIAAQLERSAQVLRTTGPQAVKLAEDWDKAALRASGSDPGRGKGGHGDPTANAADGYYDSAGEQLTLLTAEAERAYDAAVTAAERVLNIVRIVVAENERVGIGWCACGRYCDGKASNRLRSGQCPACAAKHYRDKDKPPACTHDKQHWHHGVIRCANPSCGLELTPAGRAV